MYSPTPHPHDPQSPVTVPSFTVLTKYLVSSQDPWPLHSCLTSGSFPKPKECPWHCGVSNEGIRLVAYKMKHLPQNIVKKESILYFKRSTTLPLARESTQRRPEALHLAMAQCWSKDIGNTLTSREVPPIS